MGWNYERAECVCVLIVGFTTFTVHAGRKSAKAAKGCKGCRRLCIMILLKRYYNLYCIPAVQDERDGKSNRNELAVHCMYPRVRTKKTWFEKITWEEREEIRVELVLLRLCRFTRLQCWIWSSPIRVVGVFYEDRSHIFRL